MAGRCRVGLSVYDLSARELVMLAEAAEQAGFDSLWLGEHVVHPFGYQSIHPTRGDSDRSGQTTESQSGLFPRIVEPTTSLLDPCVALAAAASVTVEICLATGIYILPLRHPLLTARAAATLAELTNGRFFLGLGSGWLKEEFDALGVDFSRRGAIQEECIEILKAAFAGGPFSYQGRHFNLPKVQVSPGPVEVPIVLGGNSDRALSRAVRLADAWFASGTPSLEEALRLRDRLEALKARHSRSSPLTIYFRVAGTPDSEVLERYKAEELTNLIFWAQNIYSPEIADLGRALAEAAEKAGIRQDGERDGRKAVSCR